MSARKRQSGQALVAALATIALLFALAGGLAVAVSAALTGAGSTADPYLRDAQAASATAAIVATVAGGSAGCPPSTTVSTAFGLGTNAYSCDGMDMVVPSQVAMVPFQWSGTCASAPLVGATHTSLWLHATRGLGSFFVDGNTGGCTPGAGACIAPPTNNSGPGRFYRIDDCNLAAFGTPYAHVSGPAGAVSVVRVAPLASFVAAPGRPYPVEGAGPIATAALRGAGTPLDLVVASRTTGTITVWWGAGDATFRLVQTISALEDISALTLADLNSDGYPDLAVTSFQQNRVSVWFGDRHGTFDVGSRQDIPVGAGPVGVVAGPLTPDPIDLATANSDGTVSILRGTPGGGLSKSANTCDVQGSPTALAVVGPRSSGTYLAVAKTVGGGGAVSVYQIVGNGNGGCNGNGNGSLGEVQRSPYGLAGIPGAMAAGHFTASGQADLAVALPTQNQAQILVGSAGGQFQVLNAFDVGDSPSALTAAQFGYSTSDDLAVTRAGGSVRILAGNGNGTFREVLGSDIAVGKAPAGVAAGDFDGSGIDGIAVTAAGDSRLSVLLRNRSRVFSILASGGGVFNEADLIWASPTHTNTLFFEGGLQ